MSDLNEDETQRLVKLATTLIGKLDVALPQIAGAQALQALRSGGRSSYDGPVLTDEIEAIRELLGLENPAAHPREFYPPDYCKHCDGTGYVPGGEGIMTNMTKMNMERWAIAVRDEEQALKWLLGRGLLAHEARELLSSLPTRVDVVGMRDTTVIEDGSRRTEKMGWHVHKDEDLSFFGIEMRRPGWDHPERSKLWRDICPECRGTGGRGLPVPT